MPTYPPARSGLPAEHSKPVTKWVAADAVLVEFGNEIRPSTLASVAALERAINETEMNGLVETVPAYTSLLVRYDPLSTTFENVESDIAHYLSEPPETVRTPRLWRIPVAFGDTFGPDAALVANANVLSERDLFERYASARYTVAMFGFLPGFAYLAGLPPELALPRRETPREHVPGGGIAIGGAQTAIGSIAGPCGWHIIGRTPINSFVPDRDPVTFLRVGDEVEFFPVPHPEFAQLADAAERGELIAEAV